MNIVNNNPWAGLASYEDPRFAERKLEFCGRDEESYDVAKLIMDNYFMTLYGKSGIGKTSLLNAGVFPKLRDEGYTPISLRIGKRDKDNPLSYQTIIIDAIERTIGRIETIDIIPTENDYLSDDFLWKYFVNHRFLDKEDNPTIPVIVFDQFEEVFRNYREEVEILLQQLNNCTVNGQSNRYETNIRFAVSIREDDLYRLEDCIDNCYLPALKRCRYRLHGLSEQGARDAVLIPGQGLFKKEEQEEIVSTIIRIAQSKKGREISTNILSLVCNRLYADYQKSDSEFITLALVDSFITGNPFERFYDEATRGFSNREKKYIENQFVDSTGRRNSISESDFLLNVPQGRKLMEGDTCILQRVSTSSNVGVSRIELIHDSFCLPLAKQQKTRDARRRVFVMAIIATILLLSISIVAFVLYQSKQVEKANWKMKVNESRYVGEKAFALIDDGDSYLARLLCVKILPIDSTQHKPYTFEAERALRKAMQKDNAILLGHSAAVWYAKYSRDGSKIISASSDKTVRVWDTRTGNCIHVLTGHNGRVNTANFSYNGKYAVSASNDKTICVWNIKREKIINQFRGHADRVNSAVFSPDTDNKLIISASFDSTVRVWNTKTGKPIGDVLKHPEPVYYATCSPDSKYIVSACKDGIIRVWDINSHKCLRELRGHSGLIDYVDFSPNGKQLVSSSNDKTIRIWDFKSGKTIKVLRGHTKLVKSANFSPNGKYIISASDDRTVRIWDVSSGGVTFMKEYSAPIKFAIYSPNMQSIAYSTVNSNILIWDRMWENCIRTIDSKVSEINSIAFNPEGDNLVSASSEGKIQVWDYERKLLIKEWQASASAIFSIAFSPDGKQLASSSGNGDIMLWNSNGWSIIDTLKGHKRRVNSVVFSPDGKYLASAAYDSTIRIWNLQTRNCIDILRGHKQMVYSVAFSSDGKRLVSSSGDGIIKIWEVSSVNEKMKNNINIFDTRYSAPINCVVFCKDGRVISASSDQTVRIWNADTSSNDSGRILGSHTDGVWTLSISSDGKRLLSGSDDTTIYIWDLETGKILERLVGHNAPVYSVVFNPNPKKPVVASADSAGVIKIWSHPPLQELIDQTVRRFEQRALTSEERHKYYLED